MKPFDKLRMQLIRRLLGRPAYRPGDLYKYYSSLHLELWQSAGVVPV